MSAILKKAESAFKALLSGDIVGFLKETLELSLYIGIVFPVEMLMKAMGVTDEDVIRTNVSSQRIIKPDDDRTTLKDLFKMASLAKAKNDGVTYAESFIESSQAGRDRFKSFFKFGRDKYTDALPDTSISHLNSNLEGFKTIIRDNFGSDVNIVSAKVSTLSDAEWVTNHLSYNDEYSNDGTGISYKEYTFSGSTDYYKIHKLDMFQFNNSTGKIDITTKTYEDLTTVTYNSTDSRVYKHNTLPVTVSVNYRVSVVVTAHGTDPLLDIKTTYYDYLVSSDPNLVGIQYFTAAATTVENVVKGSVVASVTTTLVTSMTVTVEENLAIRATASSTNSTRTSTSLNNGVEVKQYYTISLSKVSKATADTSTETITATTTSERFIANSVESIDPWIYKLYYIGTYIRPDGQQRTYTYDPELEVFPELNLTRAVTTQLDMLPVVVIRNSGVNTNSDKTTARYKETKKMLQKVGIGIDDFTDEFNKNPDIDQVQDAFIHFGVSPSDTHEAVSKLLWKTFEFIHLNDSASENDSGKHVTFNEGTMNLALSWKDGVIKNTVGTIPNGKKMYHHEVVDSTVTESSVDSDGNVTTTSTPSKSLVIYKKLNDTNVAVITLDELINVTIVKRSGLSGGVSVDVSSSDFFIPLSYFFVRQLRPIEQFELFALSLRMTVYAAIIQHVKWYETSAFGAFIKVVGFIVTVIVTIVTWGGLTKFIIMLFSALVITLALKAVFRMTNNRVIRAIAVAIAIVASMYAGGYFSGEALTAFQAVMIPLLATAGMVTVAMGTDLEMKFSELEGNRNSFEEARSTREKEISAANELLNKGIGIDDVVNLIKVEDVSPYIFGPEAFYYMAKGEATYNSYELLFEGAINKVKDFYVEQRQFGII